MTDNEARQTLLASIRVEESSLLAQIEALKGEMLKGRAVLKDVSKKLKRVRGKISLLESF
jgi:hypothetical protein